MNAQKTKQPKFSAYERLEELAAPKSRPQPPSKREGVNPGALEYVPTELILKLSKIPDRWTNLPKPLIPGQVRKGALSYIITQRVETLATPKSTELNKNLSEPLPGQVRKGALKYIITPRVETLATPKSLSEKAKAFQNSTAHWTIRQSTLNYKATPRILELAKPIERQSDN